MAVVKTPKGFCRDGAVECRCRCSAWRRQHARTRAHACHVSRVHPRAQTRRAKQRSAKQRPFLSIRQTVALVRCLTHCVRKGAGQAQAAAHKLLDREPYPGLCRVQLTKLYVYVKHLCTHTQTDLYTHVRTETRTHVDTSATWMFTMSCHVVSFQSR